MGALVILWLLACAVYDLRRREVPNYLTLPAVVLALAWRLTQPSDWLPWVLVGVTIVFTLVDVLPGGDMKGLAALALYDPRLYLAAWVGAVGVYTVWRILRRERRMPGYIGFLVGAAGGLLCT